MTFTCNRVFLFIFYTESEFWHLWMKWKVVGFLPYHSDCVICQQNCATLPFFKTKMLLVLIWLLYFWYHGIPTDIILLLKPCDLDVHQGFWLQLMVLSFPAGCGQHFILEASNLSSQLSLSGLNSFAIWSSLSTRYVEKWPQLVISYYATMLILSTYSQDRYDTHECIRSKRQTDWFFRNSHTCILYACSVYSVRRTNLKQMKIGIAVASWSVWVKLNTLHICHLVACDCQKQEYTKVRHSPTFLVSKTQCSNRDPDEPFIHISSQQSHWPDKNI